MMSTRKIVTLFISFLLPILVVSPGFSYTDSAQSDPIPWSGWWWPYTEGGLSTGEGYSGRPAPMQKYDLLTSGTYDGDATAWDLAHHYDLNALGWYGLCYAWSSAAVTENIDFKPSVYENITFKVGDKKGLLTACHAADLRETANGTDPTVFHQWLLHYIKDNGLAFAAELDPSEEVWTYPIYRYTMEVTESTSMLNVRCQIWYADDMVDPDYQGTKAITKVYTYNLLQNGLGEIVGGEWSGASVVDHPGLLWRPVSQATDNPYLDYTRVRQIAESADDALETTGTADLAPGEYNLVLLDQDRYRIPCQVGDTVLLKLTKTDDQTQWITLTIQDARSRTIKAVLVNDSEEVSFAAQNPPYTLTVSRTSYADPGFYTLQLDLKKSAEYELPRIQKGGAWVGVGVTNAGDTAVGNVYLVGRRDSGEVLKTLAGPFSLAANEKRTFLLSDLPVFVSESSEIYSLKVLSDAPVSVLSLYGNSGRNLSCFAGTSQGDRLVVPDLADYRNTTTRVWWGVSNCDANAATANLKLYKKDGTLLENESISLAANGAVSYSVSQSPFSQGADGGWVMVEGQSGARLEGYAAWLKNGLEKGESLLALNRMGTDFFIPHVASDSIWKTWVTLINLTDARNRVALTLTGGGGGAQSDLILNPFEKKVAEIRSFFPTLGTSVFNNSSLTLTSQGEVTGYYGYESSASLAYYPLMAGADVHLDLVVPHVASDGYWWTGVGMFNPSEQTVSVSLSPIDNQGQVVSDQIREVTLPGMGKMVFCVDALFDPDRIGDFSFLKIQVNSGTGVAGLFMWGDRSRQILSGSNLDGIASQ